MARRKLRCSLVLVLFCGLSRMGAAVTPGADRDEFDRACEAAKALEEKSDYADATEEYERALALGTQLFGEDAIEIAPVLCSFGDLCQRHARYGQAQSLLERSLSICETKLGPDHVDVAKSLHNLAKVHAALGQNAQAEQLLHRAIAIRKAMLGADHLEVAKSLNNLANIYIDTGRYAQAELALRESIRIKEAKLPPNDLLLASSSLNLGNLYARQEKYAQAESVYEQSLTIREAALGSDHLEVAACLFNMAKVALELGKYARCEALYERALKIRESKLGPHHPLVADTLQSLAVVYKVTEQFARAEPLYERSLEIYEAKLGPDHLDLAVCLHNQAVLYKAMGQYERAQPVLQRCLAIREKTLGPDHEDVAQTVQVLANLASILGQNAQAEQFYRRSVQIYEAKQGSARSSLALSINNLASFFDGTGRYIEALPLYQRSIEIYEAALGPEHPSLAFPLFGLGNLYRKLGQFAQAEPLLLRCLKIRQDALGDDHSEVANTLNSLALVYLALGQYPRAEPLFRRCLEIHEGKLGADHPEVATDLNNLAVLLNYTDRPAEAAPLLQRSLEIRKAKLGPNHSRVADTLTNLANLYYDDVEYALAEPLYQNSLKIYEASLSDHHPSVVGGLSKLAMLHTAMGQSELAVAEFERERRIVRRHVAQILPVLSAQGQLTFVKRSDASNLYQALTFGRLHANEPALTERSAAWLINGKSVVQASLAERILLARDSQNPQLQGQVNELTQLRTQLADLCLAVPQPGEEATHLGHLRRLSEQEHELARKVSLAAGLATKDDAWVETAAVRQSLADDAVLIEIARFQPHRLHSKRQEKHCDPAHYVAWLIPHAAADGVRVIDLGEADAIDLAVAESRLAIQFTAAAAAGPQGEAEAEKAALEALKPLAKLVLEPFLPALAHVKELVLSPDSDLWLAPWAALPLPDGQYAVERWRLRYVTSGRDLLLQQSAVDPGKRHPLSPPVVFADPDYDLDGPGRKAVIHSILNGGGAPVPDADPRERSESVEGTAKRLPGTAEEARLIAPSLERLAGKAPAVYTEGRALEDVLKRVRSPQVLVLSTHGFYLSSPFVDDAHPLENPLLRCGLLLAGCNQPASESAVDNGVVTGMEIVGCDLRGTELVVLSACNTGVGQVHNGEGVAGLRQAFQLAGAKAVVSTLWRIPDAETAELMNAFFSALAEGQDKAKALQAAQVGAIKARRAASGAAHPLFWAAFTMTGK